MAACESSSPDGVATTDLATPPGDWDETLLRAIEAARVSASPGDAPQLANADLLQRRVTDTMIYIGWHRARRRSDPELRGAIR